jgi:hypothetical protein
MGEHSENPLVPLCRARVEDLNPERAVSISCRKRSHVAEVPVTAIKAKLVPFTFVNDIWRVMRCQRCGERGFCEMRPHWALGYDRERLSSDP